MCFITAGMGGGTGTGAAPIIAKAAREMGILTVGVVTKPFQFEGSRRMKQAESGVEELQKHVDTLIIIPNQNLFRLANEKTTFTEAFALADDVLYQGVKGVTDLMVRPGIINLDFADVRSVMNEMGKAMMGTGEATGEDRAVQAAEKAIANPLLDEISLKGAKGVLINITAGPDLTLFELDEAANRIRAEVDPEANIMVGSTLDPEMAGHDAGLGRRHRHRRGREVRGDADAAAASPSRWPRRPRRGRRRLPGRSRCRRARWRSRRASRASPTTGSRPRSSARSSSPSPRSAGGAAAGRPAAHRAVRPAEVRGRGRGAARRRAVAGCAAPAAGGGAERAEGAADGPSDHAAGAARPERHSRLTINSLIHKMTGQVGREQAPRAGAASSRSRARRSTTEPAYEETERERVDIPAFLRRQAN